MELKLICDKRNELRIRGFSLGIGNCVPKEPLEGVQIATIPGYFDGMTDCSFYAAGCGLECFRHLGVQDLGDGVGVLSARLRAF